MIWSRQKDGKRSASSPAMISILAQVHHGAAAFCRTKPAVHLFVYSLHREALTSTNQSGLASFRSRDFLLRGVLWQKAQESRSHRLQLLNRLRSARALCPGMCGRLLWL